MPRNLAVSVENNFSGGLNTQATGLNFPRNACTEADNCIFHELGFVQRRPGFEFEDNYETKTINRAASAVTVFNWKNVTGDGTTDIVVVQAGGLLYFYKPSTAGYSAGELETTVTLSAHSASGAPTGSAAIAECQFAAGVGYLIVTHPYLNPFYITFDPSDDTVTATEIGIRIRDTEGVSDSLDVDERPTTLTGEHEYNLKNQGWYVDTYLTDFETAMEAYPSNADVWWVYKNFDDRFDTNTISTLYVRGTSLAPRGHYILDPFNQDRSTVSGVSNIPVVTSSYFRPTTCAFFSGRAWYAGTNYTGFESTIYFSQIVETKDDLSKCYQNSDPTNENFHELVADDGGHLIIPGAGLIYRLIPVGNSLIVFAANGIWQIAGSTGVGFTALDYTVNYVSSVKAVSANSFVDVDGYPAWWTIEGIYILLPQGEGMSVQSLSDNKIKEMYLEIPLVCKRLARGSYDPRSHTIQWLYRDTVPESLTQMYEFNKILNFNTLASSFSPWTVGGNVKINGIFLSEGFGASPIRDTVIAGTDNQVIVGSGNPVVLVSFGALVLDFSNKFLVSYADSGSYEFTFADYATDVYKDWIAYDGTGVDYTSTFTTGYKLSTEGIREFQQNYIYIFSDLSEIEETSFDFQGIWNFANSGNSGKYTSTQRVTHSSGSNFDIVRRKLKVRGSGYAVQFKFTSVSDEPFHIIGWSVVESANARD